MKQSLHKINQSTLLFDVTLVTAIFILAFCLADYMGSSIQAMGIGLGWISCILLLVSMKIMEFYFLTVKQLDPDHLFLLRGIPGLAKEEKSKTINSPYHGLIALLLILGSWAVIQFVLLNMGLLSFNNLLLLAVIMVTVFLLNGSVLHLFNTGFAELGQSFLLFGLFPLYAYQIISGESHILILLICIPLTFFYISARILVSLFQYTQDQERGRKNFLQVVGWKHSMQVHNLFILLGFVLYACIPLFGYPRQIFLHPLLTLPLGILLILMMHRIERGKKPEWQSFIFLEKVLTILVVYFLAAAMILS
jgi:1,4-dihydroxy-2-naphthoate octaprenyltransferase